MSQNNVQLAHDVMDAVERRDAEKLVELTAPDVDWSSAFALGGRYRGHDGIRQYVKDMLDAWGVVRFEVEDEIAAGAVVVFVGRIKYEGKESGASGERASGYMLKFRDGKCIRFRPFADPAEALEAVGLSE